MRCPGDKYYREIPYGMRTYEALREEVAIKFGVRPLQVVQITKGNDGALRFRGAKARTDGVCARGARADGRAACASPPLQCSWATTRT